MDDGADLTMCVVEGLNIPQLAAKTWGDIKNKSVGLKQIEQDFDELLNAVPPVVSACGVVRDDVKAAMAVLHSCCHSFGDVVKHMESNLKNDTNDAITHEIEEALRGFKEASSDFGGQHFGKALHLMVVGPYSSTVIV